MLRRLKGRRGEAHRTLRGRGAVVDDGGGLGSLWGRLATGRERCDLSLLLADHVEEAVLQASFHSRVSIEDQTGTRLFPLKKPADAYHLSLLLVLELLV